MRPPTRDEMNRRPALRHAYLGFVEAYAAAPNAMTSWIIRYGQERGVTTWADLTDAQLAPIPEQAHDEVIQVRKQRDAALQAKPWAQPEPSTVTEIRTARARAGTLTRIEQLAEEERQDRLCQALAAGAHAALLKFMDLGGRPEDLPHLQWADPIPEPFMGPLGDEVGAVRNGGRF